MYCWFISIEPTAKNIVTYALINLTQWMYFFLKEHYSLHAQSLLLWSIWTNEINYKKVHKNDTVYSVETETQRQSVSMFDSTDTILEHLLFYTCLKMTMKVS